MVEQFPKLEGRQMIMMIAQARRSLRRPACGRQCSRWHRWQAGRAIARFDKFVGLRANRHAGRKAVFAVGQAPRRKSHPGKKWLGANKFADRFANASRAQRKGAFKCPK